MATSTSGGGANHLQVCVVFFIVLVHPFLLWSNDEQDFDRDGRKRYPTEMWAACVFLCAGRFVVLSAPPPPDPGFRFPAQKYDLFFFGATVAIGSTEPSNWQSPMLSYDTYAVLRHIRESPPLLMPEEPLRPKNTTATPLSAAAAPSLLFSFCIT